jgi:pyrimidine operon attenuation protein/uracil phosphoribosyltransferase
MTEQMKKIIDMIEELSEREQSQVVDQIISLKKKKSKKSITEFIGIWSGGKPLYSRLDRDSIYET